MRGALRDRSALTIPLNVRPSPSQGTGNLNAPGSRSYGGSQPSLPLDSLKPRRRKEKDPPNDMEPVDWLLLTSEPIDTDEQILEVVDVYRACWLIEEYFSALKTGCAFERRQLESKSTLTKALALFARVDAVTYALIESQSGRCPDRNRPHADPDHHPQK